MRVLVTRPRADSLELVDALAARGHDADIEPLLDIRVRPDAPVDLSGVQALLITSANGVRAFAQLSRVRDLPVLAVGEASAAAAREAGFARVESAAGDVDALARLVVDRLDPANGALFHAAGTVTAGALAETLADRGFDVRRVPLYEAVPVDDLSKRTRTRLAEGGYDAVLFFSPRTARVFVRLANERRLADACRGTEAVCLSKAVADAVRDLPWQGVRIAERPDRAALLDLLGPRERDASGPAAPTAPGPPAPREGAEPVPPHTTPARAATKDAMTDDRKDDNAPRDPAEDKAGDGGPAATNPVDNPALAVIQRFGGIRPMAHKLGVAVSTVQGWKNRGAIPESRHDEILQAARENGIEIDRKVLHASGEAAEAAEPGAQLGEPSAQPWTTGGPPDTEPPAADEHAAGAEAEAATAAAQARESAAGEHAMAAESEASSRAGDEIRSDAWSGPAAAPTAPSGGGVPPQRPGGWLPGMFLGAALLVAGVALAGATRDTWLPYLDGQLAAPQEQPAVEAADQEELDAVRSTVADLADQVAGLEDRLAKVQQQAAGAAETAQQASQTAQQASETAREAAETADSAAAAGGEGGVSDDALAKLRQRMSDLQGRLGDATDRVGQLADRVDEATGRLQSVAQRLDGLSGTLEQQGARIDKLADRAASQQRVGQLGSRLDEVSGRVDSLAQRVEQLRQQGGVKQAARSAAAGIAAQTLAVAELRDALRFSAPFAEQLAAAREVVGDDSALGRALDQLAPYADSGVPTRAELANGFDRAARGAVAAAQGEAGEGLLGGVLRRLNDVVTVRKVGSGAEGEGAQAALARAEAKLEAGDLQAAVREVEAMPQPARGEMQGWLKQAKSRLAAERALARLSGDLMQKLVAAGDGTGGDGGKDGGAE